ncbi:class I SAM-dependent methyltransferase [Mucilaginibacter sp. E4BP6]|uniref:class I SAM-dependent methyltransferase n=1 Tax=Mucilaginibacter sp. E4BP6 TaxID=2723089 RepID=UPI0015C90E08|nr:methyltransferase [Mucilaginibacter sp. E4BP6]NYE67550.1 SAM-dependent methyltransferase [Mucilaginibacter sp. E4BP6]
MEPVRRPFHGLFNIIRFNRHLYLLSILMITACFVFNYYTTSSLSIVGYFIIYLTIATTAISLVISYYVYDLSGFYNLNWLDKVPVVLAGRSININAGFDETSLILSRKYPRLSLNVYDFYDPLKHTEISIKRARKAYPPFPGTVQIKSDLIPLNDCCVDNIFVIFSAHEIRDRAERIIFFLELRRILKPEGKIILVEHLRDVPNFLAYNIGFFHFISRSDWRKTFNAASLEISAEKKINLFVRNFIIKKNGVES